MRQNRKNLRNRQERSESSSIPSRVGTLWRFLARGQTLSYIFLFAAAGCAGFSVGRMFQRNLDHRKAEERLAGKVTRDMVKTTYDTLKAFDAPIGDDEKEFASMLPRLARDFQEIESKKSRTETEQIRMKLATALDLPENFTSEQIRVYLEDAQATGNSANWPDIRRKANLALDRESSPHLTRKVQTVQNRAMWIAFNECFPPSKADTLRYYEMTRKRFAQDFGLNSVTRWSAIQAWIEQRENRQDIHAFNTIRNGLGFEPMPKDKIDRTAWKRLHDILNHNTPMKFSQAETTRKTFVTQKGSH